MNGAWPLLEPGTSRRYRKALGVALRSGVPFLVGGGYALEHYTDIRRGPRDLDLFVRRRHVKDLLEAFAAAGFRAEIVFPHWLGKIQFGGDCIDVIFSSGNGIAEVDDDWFVHSVPTTVLGCAVQLCPPEEMIWSKGFIMERERYDGADIVHLIRACHTRLDWQRLLARFGPDWRVLLSHLVLFGYVYPGERHAIPPSVLQTLSERLVSESDNAESRLCRGPVLSRGQYLAEIQQWGYLDARVQPHGPMTPEEVARWTAAIEGDEAIEHAHCGRR
ncbi:MAG TPA: hypothetical protein VGT40_12975 [Methylomirabilota bacterium]|nr:hypothetical protein [Methylomirabilota bacterium]